MTRASRYLMVAAACILLAAACSSGGGSDGAPEATTTTAAAGGSDDGTTQDTSRDGADTGEDTATPPDDAFPDGLRPDDIKGVDDQPGDWGFFNGDDPGRSDDFVDFVHLWMGRVTATTEDLSALSKTPCKTADGTTVVCAPGAKPLTEGDYLVVTAQLADDVQQAAPSGEQGRYSLLIDAGGDDKTKSKPSAAAPDLAAAGTNMFYEVLLGVDGMGPIAMNASDFRLTTPLETTARIILHDAYVTWVIPAAEIGDTLLGVRAADIWGDAKATGDAAENNADVVPGQQHAPFTLLEP